MMKPSKFSPFHLFSYILLILYLSIGFIPNLEAVDKIAPQWVAMSILNLASLIIFFLNRHKLKNTIKFCLTSSMTITYILFIFWAGMSFFYAINSTEVLVNISRQVNVLFMFVSMAIILYETENKKSFILWVVTIILGIEIYAVLNQALEMINSTGLISPGELKGVTANRNITAFSLAIKIPFVLFLIHNLKKINLKIILSFLIFLTLLGLTIIQSRASFVAIGLIVLSFTFLNIFFYLKQNQFSKLIPICYLIIPLMLAIIINQTILADKGADAISRAATISISTKDGSVNQRIRYYKDVLTHLKSNPILGTGLGNWKLKSIDYDSKEIFGYIVPYHAHSDFIQLGAELGIIGFLLYLGVFLWSLLYVYKLLRFSKLILEEKAFLFLLVTSLGVYSIDANLNFPIARPQVLVVWSLVMAFILSYYQKNLKQINTNIKISKTISLIFFLFAISCLLPSLYITNTVFKSLKGQMFLLQDFNSNQYNLPLSKVDNIVPDIPNITVTTIPINSVKARYYVNAKKYDKALSLIEKGSNANPYLYYSEILKSEIFQKKGQLDSAKFYAKKAFYGLPNNDLHSSRYLNLILETRDKNALEEAFNLLTYNNKISNWKNYLNIASRIFSQDQRINLEKDAKKALEIFPYDNEMKTIFTRIKIGEKALNNSFTYSNKGLEYFNNQDYFNAALEFEKAIDLNPLDYAFYENAATSNYMIGNFDKALEQINKVISDLNPLNGKCEYIKALIFIRMGDTEGACPLIEISDKRGFYQARETFNQYCR